MDLPTTDNRIILNSPIENNIHDDLQPTECCRGLPDCLNVKLSSDLSSISGIFTVMKIEGGAIFGPYVGKKRGYRQDVGTFGYFWPVYVNEILDHYLDGSNDSYSNWMHYVEYAPSRELQTLEAFQYNQEIYFRVIKTLAPNKELFVWICPDYIQRLEPANIIPDNNSIKCIDKSKPHSTVTNEDNSEINIISSSFSMMADAKEEHIVKVESVNESSNEIKIEITPDTTHLPDIYTQSKFYLDEISNHNNDNDDMSNDNSYMSITDEENVIKYNKDLLLVSKLEDYKYKKISPTDINYFGNTTKTMVNNFISKEITDDEIDIDKFENFRDVKINDTLLKRQLLLTDDDDDDLENSNEIKISEKNRIRYRRCEVHLYRLSPKSLPNSNYKIHTEEKKSYKCNICLKLFNKAGYLKKHIKIHSNKKTYKCDICSKSFNRVNSFNRHIVIHSNTRPYKCDICSKSFNQNSSLKRHLVTHLGDKSLVKSLKCNVCDMLFSEDSYLRVHLITHIVKEAKDKLYRCGECSKTYSNKKSLKYHLLIHDDDVQKLLFKCDLCTKSFNQNTTLKNHLLTHRDDKPYTCCYCLKSFNRKSNFKRHLSLHFGVKPYACDICRKTFAEKNKLKRHRKVHLNVKLYQSSAIKIYKCKVCLKGYTTKEYLRRHLKVHSDITPFNCTVCHKLFVDKFIFKRHMKIHSVS